jgi:hypothetical protein
LQLTADQMVQLQVSGTDKYGNPVEITGDSVWKSSDESIITVAIPPDDAGGPNATFANAIAVGPVGTASVTFTNDVNSDGSGDYIGSIAIDVVAGEMAEIEITAGQPVPKQGQSGQRQVQARGGQGGQQGRR